MQVKSDENKTSGYLGEMKMKLSQNRLKKISKKTTLTYKDMHGNNRDRISVF